MKSPLIYNIFPRLAGPLPRWIDHARRAADMGFDWIFINPIQYPGFSGSLYAVKDFYRLNPLFVPPGCPDPMAELQRTLEQLHGLGLKVMLDLVINHTAKDSELVRQHPEWFRRDELGEVVSPSAIDPADTRNVTVWGDLAEVDNEGSAQRESLWAYWTEMMLHYLQLGVDGFRCDAAYKVPAELWEHLIGAARQRAEAPLFVAETLGCRLAEVRALRTAGFDYLFNSSKWWDFDAPWALDQHEEFGAIAPSISFPESHDTPRLMEESGGLEQVQRQRYAVAAVFSAGLMLPMGYEFGFRRKLDVVQTLPEHWEQTGLDLTPTIRRINRLKREIAVLGVEGHWEVATALDRATLVLRKSAPQLDPVALVVNKDWHAPQRCALPPSIGKRLIRPMSSHDTEPLPPGELELSPAEVALVLP